MTDAAGAMQDGRREFLRHTVATLAYRAEKVLRDVPEGFSALRMAPATRSPLELVAHLGDLVEWGERTVRGEMRWAAVPERDWEAAVGRFFAGLAALDRAIVEAAPSALPAERVFQGPIADALWHVGQLALLRGVAGAPLRPESYARASITAGRVGRDQAATRVEFDGDASPPAAQS